LAWLSQTKSPVWVQPKGEAVVNLKALGKKVNQLDLVRASRLLGICRQLDNRLRLVGDLQQYSDNVFAVATVFLRAVALRIDDAAIA